MRTSLRNIRRNPKEILEALARGEIVTLTHQSVVIGRIRPARKGKRPRTADHEAFGLWADRAEIENPSEWVRKQHNGRLKDC